MPDMNDIRIPRRPSSTIPLLGRVMRTWPVKALLWPLEKITEGKKVDSDDSRIIVTDHLSPELLQDFFTHKVLAIHMPGYFKSEDCNALAENLLKQKLTNWNIYDLKREMVDSDVNVFGEPFNMANKTDKSWQLYFTSVASTAEKLRAMALPYAYPFDTFRAMINKYWPQGIITATYKGLPMAPGLVRVMYDKDIKQTTTSLGCHVDSPPLLSKKNGLFSVNIYLKQPENGGHLYIWNPKITTMRTLFSNWNLVKNFFLESNYQNEELQLRFQKFLPKPVMIKLGQGDIVMLNTGRPHAVVPFHGGPRVSLQAFLNYKKNKPVGIWA